MTVRELDVHHQVIIMKILLSMGASALALGACANAPAPLPDVTAQQAVTNTAVSSPVKYQDPLAGYIYRGPTGPRDWRSVNQEQSEGN
ncbi:MULTISPECIES: hypothetical protein [Rhodobacterales]|uniref:Lipoprotein n=1 Tax=Pelagivirga sediminicola TaxID=2170575 RepID=A0A2T7G3L3_9RHOB|nr:MULTISPECIES: hypothetical protein [Rhodobacterales]MCQ0090385.1 hypothetical protein [Roseovarius sp. M141]PVA09017.1 hypothetical protein DC366_15765 [Pelagivirga sediminicola]